MPQEGAQATATVGSDEKHPRDDLVVGQKVEARYGGAQKWYPGLVSGVETDEAGRVSAVSVAYEDGESESNVPRLRVRVPGQKQPRVLEIGERVEARFRRKKAYYGRSHDPALGRLLLVVSIVPTADTRLLLFCGLRTPG